MRGKIFMLIVCIAVNNFLLAQSRIEIKKAWLKPASKNMNTVLFFEIRNYGQKTDTLTEVTSNISNDITFRNFSKNGNEAKDGREQRFIVIPPQTVVIFKQKGINVTVAKLKEDVKLGQRKDFFLKFRKAGTLKIKAAVRNN